MAIPFVAVATGTSRAPVACRMFLMKGMVEYGLSITGRGTELCRKTSASIRPVCGATAQTEAAGSGVPLTLSMPGHTPKHSSMIRVKKREATTMTPRRRPVKGGKAFESGSSLGRPAVQRRQMSERQIKDAT